MPPYEVRAEYLLAKAHELLVSVRGRYGLTVPDPDETERWLDSYAIHTALTDHPDLRDVNHT